MEMSLQVIDQNIAKTIPNFHKTRPPRQKSCHCNNLNAISCRANKELAMPRKKTNFYEVLSLGSRNVGFDEIKKAYRSMALIYHPDVCPPCLKEESTTRFVELREAYETLSDPISRRVYDYELDLMVSSSSGSFGFVSKNKFSKAVWEKQLEVLKQRSHERASQRNTCRK